MSPPQAENATRDIILEAAGRSPLSAAALDRLDVHLTPIAYVNRLLEKELYLDALEFIARVLAAPGALWWGCICAWHPARSNVSEPEAGAFRAVVRWLQQPNEERRRAAAAAGNVAGMSKPAGVLAMAVFWSGGSLSSPKLPEVLPPPDLTATTVVAALQLAANGDVNELRRFVGLARPLLEQMSVLPQTERQAAFDDSVAKAWNDAGSVSKKWDDSDAIVGRPPTPRRAEAPSPSPPPPTKSREEKRHAKDDESWGGMSELP